MFQDDVISKETRAGLEKIMQQDYKLYNFFKEKFQRQVETFGESRMAAELAELDRVNNEVTEKCNFEEADNKKLSGKFKWWGSADLVGYMVSTYVYFIICSYLWALIWFVD